MHGHLNVRRIGLSESVNRCRVNVKGSGDVGNGFAFQNKATCQFTLIQSKLSRPSINTSICWAATPLWCRNPWSDAKLGQPPFFAGLVKRGHTPCSTTFRFGYLLRLAKELNALWCCRIGPSRPRPLLLWIPGHSPV